MNKFIQHIPSFVDGVDPEVIEFGALDELLSTPLFKKWSEYPGFSAFEVEGRYILAVAKNGFAWWVIGVTEKPVDLPPWRGWMFEGQDEKVYGKSDVVMSCGNEITLRDGRKVQVK